METNAPLHCLHGQMRIECQTCQAGFEKSRLEVQPGDLIMRTFSVSPNDNDLWMFRLRGFTLFVDSIKNDIVQLRAVKDATSQDIASTYQRDYTFAIPLTLLTEPHFKKIKRP